MEYACAYVFYYNMILNLKESNMLEERKLDNIKEMVKSYTDSKDEAVCKKHKISTIFFEEWLKKSKKDQYLLSINFKSDNH
jgi:hypothetical protein